MSEEARDRVYANHGNERATSLVDRGALTVLDVGCGAGDNAALLVQRDPEMQIDGITASSAEARIAAQYMRECWVADLEAQLPDAVCARTYDVVFCSHVLEHLREPARVLKKLVERLRPGGSCIVAVPNVMNWRQRAAFVAGHFEYEETGVMDSTHLRFFSYRTADRYLLSQTPELRVVSKTVTGSVPLWLLRRRVLPTWVSARIDQLGCAKLPNLFGGEVLIKAVKEP